MATMTERFARGSGRPLVTKQKSMDDVLSELQGNAMFLSFGKRSGGTGRRMNECLILEPSEMVVVSTPFIPLRATRPRALVAEGEAGNFPQSAACLR